MKKLTPEELWALKQVNGRLEWDFVVTAIKRVRGWTEANEWPDGCGYPEDWAELVLKPETGILAQLEERLGRDKAPGCRAYTIDRYGNMKELR